MIQRVQTLWLLLAAACAALTLKYPFYSGNYIKDNTTQLLTGTSSVLLVATTIILTGLILFNIFLYKQRKLQLRLCIVGMLVDVLVIFLYFREMQDYSTGTFSLSAILHGGILAGLFLAARGISRDERIVKESDRLR